MYFESQEHIIFLAIPILIFLIFIVGLTRLLDQCKEFEKNDYDQSKDD